MLAAAFVTFAGSVIALPISYRSPSCAGRLLSALKLEGRGGCCMPGSPWIFFCCGTSGNYVFDRSNRNLPQMARAYIVLNLSASTAGLWAPTETTASASVRVSPCAGTDESISDAEEIQIRAAFLDNHVVTHPEVAVLAEHVRAADGSISTPITSTLPRSDRQNLSAFSPSFG